MNKILIIEDDQDIRDGVRILLEGEGFSVLEAADGTSGLALAGDAALSLIILDIMMPGLSGISVCKQIRSFSNVPVLFLTAKTEESDKLIGFEAGGDDYLVKPFSYVELLARVKAQIRRHQEYNSSKSASDDTSDAWISKGNVRVNKEHNQVFRCDKELFLTDIEYRILLLLMEYPKKVFSVSNIYESVWNEPFYSTCANTVMVHIRNLRMKMEEDPKKPLLIQTVWGKGYRLG